MSEQSPTVDHNLVDLRGRAAYLAYRECVDGRAVNGDPLPGWEGLLPRIREAWRAAADAAVMVTELRGGS